MQSCNLGLRRLVELIAACTTTTCSRTSFLTHLHIPMENPHAERQNVLIQRIIKNADKCTETILELNRCLDVRLPVFRHCGEPHLSSYVPAGDRSRRCRHQGRCGPRRKVPQERAVQPQRHSRHRTRVGRRSSILGSSGRCCARDGLAGSPLETDRDALPFVEKGYRKDAVDSSGVEGFSGEIGRVARNALASAFTSYVPSVARLISFFSYSPRITPFVHVLP